MAAKKSESQLANERLIAETQGSYAESVQKEGTKQRLIDAISAKNTALASSKSTISPMAVLFLVFVAMIGTAVFLDKKSSIGNAVNG